MPRGIDREELQRLMKEGAQLVEVLPKEEYDEEHLPGAISIPLRNIDQQARDRLDPERPVIVYCWDDP
jgi:rhodanese-related sulfurtransferase